MLKKLSVLLLVLALVSVCPGILAEEPASPERTVHADLLLTVDYGDQVTYVIGHKSPDADTVGSAIAYAGLLQQLGISAKAAVAGPVNQETKYALDLFGIDQPEVLSDAAGKQFVLVDHSEYTQALDGMRSARIVGVVDHHGIGDVFADSEESILTLSERIEAEFPKIYASSKMDMLFCLVSTENRTRMIWCGDGAEALVRAAFPDYDGSGSLIFEPKAPRKSKVVPPLTRALEEKQK